MGCVKSKPPRRAPDYNAAPPQDDALVDLAQNVEQLAQNFQSVQTTRVSRSTSSASHLSPSSASVASHSDARPSTLISSTPIVSSGGYAVPTNLSTAGNAPTTPMVSTTAGNAASAGSSAAPELGAQTFSSAGPEFGGPIRGVPLAPGVLPNRATCVAPGSAFPGATAPQQTYSVPDESEMYTESLFTQTASTDTVISTSTAPATSLRRRSAPQSPASHPATSSTAPPPSPSPSPLVASTMVPPLTEPSTPMASCVSPRAASSMVAQSAEASTPLAPGVSRAASSMVAQSEASTPMSCRTSPRVVSTASPSLAPTEVAPVSASQTIVELLGNSMVPTSPEAPAVPPPPIGSSVSVLLSPSLALPSRPGSEDARTLSPAERDTFYSLEESTTPMDTHISAFTDACEDSAERPTEDFETTTRPIVELVRPTSLPPPLPVEAAPVRSPPALASLGSFASGFIESISQPIEAGHPEGRRGGVSNEMHNVIQHFARSVGTGLDRVMYMDGVSVDTVSRLGNWRGTIGAVARGNLRSVTGNASNFMYSQLGAAWELMTSGLSDDRLDKYLRLHVYKMQPGEEAFCCAICTEGVGENRGLNFKIVRICGSHDFHFGCLREWLLRKNNCPLCRRENVVPLDVARAINA